MPLLAIPSKEGLNPPQGDTMSCLQGYAYTTYDYLVENLGQPRTEGLDKSTAEWNQTSFYVYDWKLEETPKGLHYWHIGGESKQALKDFTDTTGIPTVDNIGGRLSAIL